MTMTTRSTAPWALAALLACSCSLGPDLPTEAPALADVEEPLDLRGEPDDEAARAALPHGAFSGVYLRDARETLEAKLNDPPSVLVERVVENSPAAMAGVAVGDLVLEVEVNGGRAQEITTPSEWRQLELRTPPGAVLTVYLDRAGREAETRLTLTERARPAPRVAGERYREEQRIGVVVRTATEAEARAAELGPGGGAVIVGMSQASPWRRAGLRFGDLIVALDGQPLAHPQQLLDAARDPAREALDVTFLRGGERRTRSAPLTRRAQRLSEVSLPPLFRYSSARGRSEWSVLSGLVGYRSTKVAWRFGFLWWFTVQGGDGDELQESGA